MSFWYTEEMNSLNREFPLYLPCSKNVDIFKCEELKNAIKVVELAYNRTSVETIEDMIEFISFTGGNTIILKEFQKCYNSKKDWNDVIILIQKFYCQYKASGYIEIELDEIDCGWFLEIWKSSLKFLHISKEESRRTILIDKYNHIFSSLSYFGGEF